MWQPSHSYAGMQMQIDVNLTAVRFTCVAKRTNSQHCSRFPSYHSTTYSPLASFLSLRPVSASVVANEMGRLEDDNTCVICLSAPRQCGFLHAGTTHDIVCRACAKAIPVGAPCPLCRQKVEALLPMEGVAEPAPMHAPPPAAPIFV